MGSPLPGGRDLRTITPRQILKTLDERLNPNVVVLDSSKTYDGKNTGYEDEIRAGYLLGKITASGLYRGMTRSELTSAASATNVIRVDDPRAFIVGDSIKVDTGTARTITAIDYTTHLITLSGDTDAGEVVGAAVWGQDGSATLRGVLDEFVKLKDSEGTLRNMQVGRCIIAGCLDRSELLGDISAVETDDSSNQVLKALQLDESF